MWDGIHPLGCTPGVYYQLDNHLGDGRSVLISIKRGEGVVFAEKDPYYENPAYTAEKLLQRLVQQQ